MVSRMVMAKWSTQEEAKKGMFMKVNLLTANVTVKVLKNVIMKGGLMLAIGTKIISKAKAS